MESHRSFTHLKKIMDVVRKSGVAFFLAVLLAGTVGAHVMPDVARHQETAPCHEDGQNPSPVPANYQCCRAGHNSIILQETSCPVTGIVHLGYVVNGPEPVTSSLSRQVTGRLAMYADPPPVITRI